ncbi:MAG: Hsp20/alpha crystallin family protein [Candidatus Dadabacteria bacterium]|nr:MAG: Hsp20/alpha crystallin family protein [Candidatus Dadabacteria bacterium]
MAVWDPFRELERLRQEMDRIFEGVLPTRGWTLEFMPGVAARRYPRVNVAEQDDQFIVEALAPGVDPASLDVTVKDNVVTISGEKSAPEGVKPEAFHRNERAAGRFTRSVELPSEVDPNDVKAVYADGILQVVLPKAEEARPRKIAIEVG